MNLNKLMLQHAVGLTAPSVRTALLKDAGFSREAGYRTTRTITFQGMPFDSDRLARDIARLYRTNNEVKVRAETGVEAVFAIDPADGYVICDGANRRTKLPQLCVFSGNAGLRLAALDHVPEFGGLLPNERIKWEAELTASPANASRYNRLLDALKATPVAHALRLATPDRRPIRLDEFVPADPALMRRAIGSYSRHQRVFANALLERRRDWIVRDDPMLLELALSTAVRADMGIAVPNGQEAAAKLAQRISAIAPGLDVFSRVAALEFLTAAADRFPDLDELARTGVTAHQEQIERLGDELKIFGGVFLMAQAQLSSEATRDASWRHRRGYAWMLACSAARGLIGRIDASAFFRWAYNELGHRYRIAVALDKAAAPRWSWSDGDPGQLRNEVMGRLFIVAHRFDEAGERIGLKALLADDKAHADKDGSFPFWLMSAPLEAELPARRGDHRAPISFERACTKRLALKAPEQAFAGAANLGRLKLPRPALLKAVAARLERVTAEEMLDAKGDLHDFVPALVHFAAITGSAAMADKLSELLIALAAKASAPIANAVVHNLLECAKVEKKGRMPETDFAQSIRRAISETTTAEASLQIETLLRELLRHRPVWKQSLLPLIAASELAQ